MTQPMAGPWDSPKLVTVNKVPKVFPLIWEIIHEGQAQGVKAGCEGSRNTSLIHTIDNTMNRTKNSAFNQPAAHSMENLNANDLKVRGVAAIEEALNGQTEAIISVRGTQRFVVMEMAHYHYLRECELEAALVQSRADIASGRFVQETAAEHAARLEALLLSERSDSSK